MRGHIGAMLESGEAIPDPTSHELSDVVAWLDDEEDALAETWVGIFPVEVEFPQEAESVTIRMKAELVRNIAEMAETSSGSFDSRSFIESAVQHELERYRKSA